MKNCWIVHRKARELEEVRSYIKTLSADIDVCILFPDKEPSAVCVTYKGSFIFDVTRRHKEWKLGYYINRISYDSADIEVTYGSQAFWWMIEEFLYFSLDSFV